MKAQNIVGPQIRRLRNAANLTQEQFSARCGVLGWRLSRSTLAKIEAQVRCVSDAELFVLAKALRKEVDQLYSTDRSAILVQLRHSDE
ncbi:MAG: helix-turn-helix transcriptional regulator [Opitutaceae bacterium]|jgi:transcriptional regulator with XRE-family HTH domain